MNICFTCPILHCVDRLHTATMPLRRQLLLPWGLSLRTYNIRDGRGLGHTQAIWAVQLISFDVMILTYTNITSEEYFHSRLGYNVVCSPTVTTANSGAQGGVDLVVRKRP